MKTNHYLTVELTQEEMTNTIGGTLAVVDIGMFALSSLLAPPLIPYIIALSTGWTDVK